MREATLGRLERVDLRYIWESEATGFTPWLAREENLALLGEAIGLDLELEAQERNVGPFRADILCKETTDNQWVLIENQLERTDHTHLGQLLTYAAGLQAVTIVWIAQRFTEEHRAALDWLNEITDDRFNFFGLEIELWKIGDSPVAPKFNIISKPNDWSKTIGQSARQIESGEITPIKQLQLEFWNQLSEHLNQRSGPVKARKPRPQHWMNFSIGRSDFKICLILNTWERECRTEIHLTGPHAKAHYLLLEQQKPEIESEFGEPLIWRKMEGQKRSIILTTNPHLDPNKREQWPAMLSWFEQQITKMHKVFAERIRNLEISDLMEDSAE
jgi:hypothetical protein